MMSGPKRTTWQIRQEEYRRLKEQQARNRQRQIDEINLKIRELRKACEKLPQHSKAIVNQWLNEIDTSGDLRICFRRIRGVKNYLSSQEQKLKKQAKERMAFEQKQKELELQRELQKQRINSLVEDLEAIKDDYKEILNDGIIQRVELFKNSIKTNPNNNSVLKQIDDFKLQLNKLYQEYIDKQEQREYVAESFAKILNTHIDKDDNGNFEVNGKIDGVSISVSLPSDSNHIELDTPTDGSCKRGLKALQDKLLQADIDLGVIQVLKTGEVLNQNKTLKIDNRIKI